MAAIVQPTCFVNHLKVDPELSFHKFKRELYNELMNTENAILGPNGALFIIQTEAEFQSTPGNLLHAAIPAAPAIAAIPAVPAVAAAMGVAAVAAIAAVPAVAAVAAVAAVYRNRYDYTSEVPPWLPGSPAGLVKASEMLISNRAKVYAAVTEVRSKLINSIPDEDVNQLSVYPYGIGTRTCFEIYKHAENQYSKLTQTDFTLIANKLRAHKTASQTYAALASLHRDFHATMQDAGQPISELDKSTFLLEALSTDSGSMYAAQLYIQAQPELSARTFAGLAAYVQMHARNQSITSQALHYSPALAAHIPVNPLPAVPALGVDAVAALQARVAQLEKDNAALKSSGGGGKTKKALSYCWVHGTCYHSGRDCTVMLADTTKYTAAHLNAKGANKPVGGSTRTQK
jgi:hypothetical protein